MKKGTRVLVEWLDIQAALHTEDKIEPVRAESLGWIESDTKKYLRLCTCRYLDGFCDLSDKIVIPKGCIENISEV